MKQETVLSGGQQLLIHTYSFTHTILYSYQFILFYISYKENAGNRKRCYLFILTVLLIVFHSYLFILFIHFLERECMKQETELLIHTYSFTASAAVTLPISLSYFKEQHKTERNQNMIAENELLKNSTQMLVFHTRKPTLTNKLLSSFTKEI